MLEIWKRSRTENERGEDSRCNWEAEDDSGTGWDTVPSYLFKHTLSLLPLTHFCSLFLISSHTAPQYPGEAWRGVIAMDPGLCFGVSHWEKESCDKSEERKCSDEQLADLTFLWLLLSALSTRDCRVGQPQIIITWHNTFRNRQFEEVQRLCPEVSPAAAQPKSKA